MQANLRQKKSSVVLVVDDDSDYRSIVADILSLRRPDITVLQASDGLEALELLESLDTPPSVIFMDIEMPHLDGCGTMKRIRSTGSYDSIAVLIVSSLSVENQKEMTGRRADGYIAKSAEIEQLDELAEIAAKYCDKLK